MLPVGNYSQERALSIRSEHVCIEVSVTVTKMFQKLQAAGRHN